MTTQLGCSLLNDAEICEGVEIQASVPYTAANGDQRLAEGAALATRPNGEAVVAFVTPSTTSEGEGLAVTVLDAEGQGLGCSDGEPREVYPRGCIFCNPTGNIVGTDIALADGSTLGLVVVSDGRAVYAQVLEDGCPLNRAALRISEDPAFETGAPSVEFIGEPRGEPDRALEFLIIWNERSRSVSSLTRTMSRSYDLEVFSGEVELDTVCDPTCAAIPVDLGRPDVLEGRSVAISSDDIGFIFLDESRNGVDADIYYSVINASSELVAGPALVATDVVSRGGMTGDGVRSPTLAGVYAGGDEVLLVWTEVTGDERLVARAALYPAFPEAASEGGQPSVAPITVSGRGDVRGVAAIGVTGGVRGVAWSERGGEFPLENELRLGLFSDDGALQFSPVSCDRAAATLVSEPGISIGALALGATGQGSLIGLAEVVASMDRSSTFGGLGDRSGRALGAFVVELDDLMVGDR